MGIWTLQWQREALEKCCLFICKDFLSLLQSWQFLQQVNAIVRGVMHRQNVRHAMPCIVKAYILNHMATEGPGRTAAIRTATSGVTGPCSLRILVTICPSQDAGGCLRNSRGAGGDIL